MRYRRVGDRARCSSSPSRWHCESVSFCGKFSTLLRKHHTRRRGQRTFRESQALYPIAAQFNLHSLKTILDTYELRQKAPNLTLWEIAQKLSLGTKLTTKDTPAEMVHKKSVLSTSASKKLALARRIIDGVGRGVFPAFSMHERSS
jgi:hypothetical protein